MDCLPLPHSGSLDEDDIVPYVCREQYDGGPFLTYPLRLSPPKPHYLDPYAFNLRIMEETQGLATAELEVFFQTWLFFGLLHEIFGHSFKYDDFLDQSSSGEVRVTTSSLPRLLADLKHELETYTFQELEMRDKHIEDCLKATFNALFILIPELDSDFPVHPNFQRSLRTSIAAIADQISVLRLVFEEKSGINSVPSSLPWRKYFWDDTLRNKMIKNGWCPSQLKIVCQGSFSSEPTWYLSKMQRPGEARRHQSCSEEICKALQIDKKTYVPSHKIDDCACEEVPIDQTELNRLIVEGFLPLLRIDKAPNGEHFTASLVSASPETPYVAFSHVWADGMGNPTANALYRCQFESLIDVCLGLFHSVYDRHHDSSRTKATATSAPTPYEAQSRLHEPLTDSRTSLPRDDQGSVHNQDDSEPPFFFWIDTLCCPIGPPHVKNLALTQMREIYANASFVLVLDASLQLLQSRQLCNLELWFAISSCGWARRLWTAQEAYLARSLWFQFEDGPRLATDLLDLEQSFSEQLRGFCIFLRMAVRPSAKKDQLSGLRFFRTSQSVRDRSVSVAADEPLCLATLLGVDLSAVIQNSTSRDTRMAKVWELGCAKHDISQDIVFHSTERLSQPGFRWAPKSLLESSYNSTKLLAGKRNGKLTKSGMLVKLSAFKCIRHLGTPSLPVSSHEPSGIEVLHIQSNIQGTMLMLSLDDTNNWNLLHSSVPVLSGSTNVEFTTLLQKLTLQATISRSDGTGLPALLGYTINEGGRLVFRSVEMVSLGVGSSGHSYAIRAALDIALMMNDEDPIQTIRSLPLARQNEDDEIFGDALRRLKERLWEVSEAKVNEEEFIRATDGQVSSLHLPTYRLLRNGYGVVTEIFEDQEFIVD